MQYRMIKGFHLSGESCVGVDLCTMAYRFSLPQACLIWTFGVQEASYACEMAWSGERG